MTLDEAIKHLQETISDNTKEWSCQECKSEHVQLLKWLEELKQFRGETVLKYRHGNYVTYRVDYLLDNLSKEIYIMESARRLDKRGPNNETD